MGNIPVQSHLPPRHHIAPVKAIAIGASTGGPQALATLFKGLSGQFPRVPVFVTQHMPPGFTRLLAQQLATLSGRPCAEAVDGETAQAGSIYIAPGDYHMVPAVSGDAVILHTTQSPPVNFCRPSVDPMLGGLSRIYGEHLLAVILTGIGSDGLEGARAVAMAGGTVIAQDEKSSVVYGMPRAVKEKNLASAIVPIDEMASYILRVCA